MRFTCETIDGDAWVGWLRRSWVSSVVVSEIKVGIDSRGVQVQWQLYLDDGWGISEQLWWLGRGQVLGIAVNKNTIEAEMYLWYPSLFLLPLGIELRASHMLAKHCTTELKSQLWCSFSRPLEEASAWASECLWPLGHGSGGSCVNAESLYGGDFTGEPVLACVPHQE